MSEATGTSGLSNGHLFTHPQSDTSISPLSLLLPFFFVICHFFPVFWRQLYTPFTPTWTYLHSAAPLRVCFPMLPLHVSSCPEVALLFLVPDGSVLCDSAVSCKQTILIGRCYSWVWKHVPRALSPLCDRVLGRGDIWLQATVSA